MTLQRLCVWVRRQPQLHCKKAADTKCHWPPSISKSTEDMVSETFIKPIKLEFEKVYCPYLLMNKKPLAQKTLRGFKTVSHTHIYIIYIYIIILIIYHTHTYLYIYIYHILSYIIYNYHTHIYIYISYIYICHI